MLVGLLIFFVLILFFIWDMEFRNYMIQEIKRKAKQKEVAKDPNIVERVDI